MQIQGQSPSVGSSANKRDLKAPSLQVTRFAAWGGLVFFATAVFSTAYVIAPVGPPAYFNLWITLSSAFLLAWLVISTVFVLRNPSREENERVWAPIAKFILVTSSLITTATVWLFWT